MLGACRGLEEVGWTDIPVLAAETEGAASFAATHRAGELVSINTITSLAKSLGALKVAEACVPAMKKFKLIPIIVSDKEAVEGCYRLSVDERVMVEPACGAALAAAIKFFTDSNTNAAHFVGPGPLVVVVCGGNMISPKLMDTYLQTTKNSGFASKYDVQ